MKCGNKMQIWIKGCSFLNKWCQIHSFQLNKSRHNLDVYFTPGCGTYDFCADRAGLLWRGAINVPQSTAPKSSLTAHDALDKFRLSGLFWLIWCAKYWAGVSDRALWSTAQELCFLKCFVKPCSSEPSKLSYFTRRLRSYQCSVLCKWIQKHRNQPHATPEQRFEFNQWLFHGYAFR